MADFQAATGAEVTGAWAIEGHEGHPCSPALVRCLGSDEAVSHPRTRIDAVSPVRAVEHNDDKGLVFHIVGLFLDI